MTKNFSKESQLIREGRFNVVYRRHLSDGLQKRSVAIKEYLHDKIHKEYFRNELDIVSILHHENIVPFIGYADELGAIISEYAVNGSLDSQLKDPNMSITWTQRLKICIGVAKGLRYLHSGFGEYQRVIHGDFGSRKILLYDNLEPKICGFRDSFLFPGYRRDAYLADPVGHIYYMDPVYLQSKIRNKESDVYSYGMVLFEVLTGMLACEARCIGDEEPLHLVSLVRHYYANQLDKLIDPRIRDEIDASSLYTFKEIAYKCISFNVKDRPSWNKIIKRLEEALYIQVYACIIHDLILALIGATVVSAHGAFRILEDLFLDKQDPPASLAFCLSLVILKNSEDPLIPLIRNQTRLGVKGPETRIGDGGFGVVYKGQPSERWQNRTVAIKCLCPESYQGEYEFRNELNMIFSFNHENIIPFIGYCDEGNEKVIVYEYASNGSLDCHINDESGVLRKESDVYSFGVVMFELLSGMLAYNRRKIEGGKSKPLINIVRRYYHYKPELLIDPLVRDEIDIRSFDTYSKVAFQCISFNSKERPTMETIVDRIEEALEFQIDPFVIP
ncbi:protein kinase, ATP binding site-containing protein [Tanacetum coccineum]